MIAGLIAGVGIAGVSCVKPLTFNPGIPFRLLVIPMEALGVDVVAGTGSLTTTGGSTRGDFTGIPILLLVVATGIFISK